MGRDHQAARRSGASSQSRHVRTGYILAASVVYRGARGRTTDLGRGSGGNDDTPAIEPEQFWRTGSVCCHRFPAVSSGLQGQ